MMNRQLLQAVEGEEEKRALYMRQKEGAYTTEEIKEIHKLWYAGLHVQVGPTYRNLQ